MASVRFSILIAFVVGAFATPVAAGVADSPLPLLGGAKSKHVFSVAGVVSGIAGLETVVLCTSLEKTKSINVAVEVFPTGGGAPANSVAAGNGAVFIPPGFTATIATANTSLVESDVINGLPAISQGSARILSVSKKLMCSALVMDPNNTPPTSMASLHVVKKTSQKGD